MRVFLVFVAVAACAVADPRIVQLDSGAIAGFVNNVSRSFLGVPFASPPVGALRWQSPVPAQPWSGVRNATWIGSSCMQKSDAFTLLSNISEDCLYLNVFTPFPVPTEPLPVMLFFYGGSWKEGSASFFLYNADQLITTLEDVIVVTANYRLQAFGFLASESLRQEDADGSCGNYGLQDQRMAMQWLQKNAAAFGGDPTRVTIFGESAGAGSVSNHLLSPRSKGLFHRAIAESGPIAQWTAQSYNTSVVKFKSLASTLNCCPSASCSDTDPAVVACLRNMTAEEILEGSKNMPSGVLQWSPVIDGVDVIGVPEDLAAKGLIFDVPVMFGTNADEGTEFTSCPKDLPSANYTTFLQNEYGAALTAVVEPYYPLSAYEQYSNPPFWASSHIIGDSMMTCAARRSAKWSVASRSNTTGAPVYTYFFNHTLEVVSLFVPNKGVFHGSELAFVFDFVLGLWTGGEKQLAKAFGTYWTTFAATGVPGGEGLPVWPAFDVSTLLTAVLDVDSVLTPVSMLKEPVCSMWDVTRIPDNLIWG